MLSILSPFTWLIDHTLGYLYDALCWLLNNILPDSFTLIITKYKDLFYDVTTKISQIDDKLIVIRRGKKNYYMVRV